MSRGNSRNILKKHKHMPVNIVFELFDTLIKPILLHYCIFLFLIFLKNFIEKTVCTVILTNQTTSLNYNVKHWQDV